MGGYNGSEGNGDSKQPLTKTHSLAGGGKVELTMPEGLSGDEQRQWHFLFETYAGKFDSAVRKNHIHSPQYPQHEGHGTQHFAIAPAGTRVLRKKGGRTPPMPETSSQDCDL
jgi:hypothetical protein